MGFKEAGLRGSLRNVSVGAVEIPDSEVNHRWILDEGSGTTAADSVGNVPLTLNGPSWVSGSQYAGGAAIDLDGDNDWVTTDSNIDVNGAEFTIMFWVDGIQNGGSDTYSRIVQNSAGDAGRPTDGYEFVFYSDTTDTFRLDFFDGGTGSELFGATGISGPDISTGQYFIAILGNGDSGRVLMYDTSSQVFDESGTGGRGTTTTTPLTFGAGDGRYVDGGYDDVMGVDAELSVATIEDIWQATGPNAGSSGGVVSNVITQDAMQDTLRAQNNPTAVADGGTVYVAHQLADQDGNDDTQVVTDVLLTTVDTSTGDMTTTTVETDGTSIDNHFVPSVAYDSTGDVIHLCYGKEDGNGDRAVRHAYSTDGGSSWTATGFAATDTSYINSAYVGGSLYLFSRNDATGSFGNLDVFETSDQGSSWSSTELIDIGELVYTHGIEVDGSDIHLHLNVRDDPGQPMIYVGHVRYDTSDGTLYSSDGTVLTTPASLSDLQNNNSIIEGDGTYGACGTDIFLDSSGNPYLAYVADRDDNAIYDLYFARFNGTSWDTTEVATAIPSGDEWRSGRFVMAIEEATDEFSIYATMDSYLNGSQDLNRWDSTDGGSTWGSQQVERTFSEYTNGARNVAPIIDGTTEYRYLAVENVQTGETFPDYIGNDELVSLTDNWEDSG